MQPGSIIKGFHILDDAVFGIFPSVIGFKINKLSLQGMEKRFNHGSVIAVSCAAHTLDEPVLWSQSAECRASILHTTIRMKHNPGTGPAAKHLKPVPGPAGSQLSGDHGLNGW